MTPVTIKSYWCFCFVTMEMFQFLGYTLYMKITLLSVENVKYILKSTLLSV